MKGYVEQLERLGYVLPQDLSVGLILNSLTSDFDGFKANKKSLNAKGKGKEKGNGKDKSYTPKPKNLKPSVKEYPTKDDACHHCKEEGVELEEIKDEDTSLYKNTSEIPMEVEVEELTLGDINEPANYKATILDTESDKWLDAMNAKMQSMKDNQVWCLVNLPPNSKIVASKWFFKKKTNMDGIVHTYKAHFIAKGFTQTYKVDYEETFSPIANIRAIRILIAIAAFYDYEIWKMDVKTAFLNGYLDEDIYMVQPEGFVDPKHPRKRYKMDNSKHGNIFMKERSDLNKTQVASTPGEVKLMQNAPYALAVGSIMYVVRCTRPDVAFAQNITSRFQQNP
nr:putative retrotransposon Ty1-copia subclass protein [Tanacetum cinerariifolium]